MSTGTNRPSASYEQIRERWDREDNLFLTRTGIFLTANSILAAAAQLSDDPVFRVGAALFSIAITILWWLTSWHSARIIARLFDASKHMMPDEIMAIYRLKPMLFRPTTVFGKLLPAIVTVGWGAYIAWVLTTA